MSESGALRQVFAQFGVQFNDEQLQRGAQSVGGVIERIQQLGAVLAGNRIVQGIRAFASEFEESTGRLQDTADQLGTSTDELQEMQFVAQSAGINAEQSAASFARFQQNIAGAAAGAGPAAQTFRALGVHVKDAAGHIGQTSDLFDGAMAALAGITDGTERARRAQELFGRAGARMANVAGQGADAVARLRAEFHANGGGISPEAAAAAGAYGDAVDRADVAMAAARSTLAVALLPALTWLVQKGTAAVAWAVHFTNGTHLMQIAMTALGAAGVAAAVDVLVAWLPVLAPFLAVAAAVGALGLLLDDFLVMMRGGDSVLGRFLDRLGGVGTHQRLVRQLANAWAVLRRGLDAAWVSLGIVWQALGPIGRALAPLAHLVAAFGQSFVRLHVEAFTALVSLASQIQGLFGRLWAWVGDQFGAMWGRVGAQINGLLQRAATVLGIQLPALQDTAAGRWAASAADAVRNSDAGRAAAGVVDAARLAAQVAAEVRGAWAGVADGTGAIRSHGDAAGPPGGAPGSTPRGLTRDVAAPPAARVVHRTTNRTTHNHVEVHGVSDPREAAGQVERRLNARERAQRDADHPVPGDEL